MKPVKPPMTPMMMPQNAMPTVAGVFATGPRGALHAVACEGRELQQFSGGELSVPLVSAVEHAHMDSVVQHKRCSKVVAVKILVRDILQAAPPRVVPYG